MDSERNDTAATGSGTRATMALESQNAEDEYRIEEKKLVRKIDWILMPILTITLGLQVSPVHLVLT